MSAAVTERNRTATRPGTARAGARTPSAIPRGAPPAPAIPAQRTGGLPTGSAAAGKAYARREERARRISGLPRARGAVTAGRTQFVLLVMVLLGVGLVATLWLSTAAAADSYKLQDARTAAQALTLQSEQLHRQVAAMDSAPALARRAEQLGMVPVHDAARLVVGPDGSVTVSGTPEAAVAPPPPPPPAAPAAAAPAPTGGAAPAAPDAPAPATAPSPNAAAQVAGPGPH